MVKLYNFCAQLSIIIMNFTNQIIPIPSILRTKIFAGKTLVEHFSFIEKTFVYDNSKAGHLAH